VTIREESLAADSFSRTAGDGLGRPGMGVSGLGVKRSRVQVPPARPPKPLVEGVSYFESRRKSAEIIGHLLVERE